MAGIPVNVYSGLGGVFIGGLVTFLTTWLTQRGQIRLEDIRTRETRRQLVFKERAEKVYQFTVDLTALVYAFLTVTWDGEHGNLNPDLLKQYFDEVQRLMPRVYGGYVLVAGLDDDLGSIAGELVEIADKLDVSIGEATLNASGYDAQRMTDLHLEAESFAKSVTDNLAKWLKKNRLDTVIQDK
jgi:hypothetical protein